MDRWPRDQPQPGSLFQRLREAEKRDPGNEGGTRPETKIATFREAREALLLADDQDLIDDDEILLLYDLNIKKA